VELRGGTRLWDRHRPLFAVNDLRVQKGLGVRRERLGGRESVFSWWIWTEGGSGTQTWAAMDQNAMFKLYLAKMEGLEVSNVRRKQFGSRVSEEGRGRNRLSLF